MLRRSLTVALVLFLLLPLAGSGQAPASSDWLTWGYDQERTGWNRAETTLSMLVATPKPRLVKLKIPAAEQDSFSVGGSGEKANHHVVHIDLGGITGVAAKVVGKQPPPMHVWMAARRVPVFLRIQGSFFEDGPICKIELARPSWPKAQATK